MVAVSFVFILITILYANYVEAENTEAYFCLATIIAQNAMPIDVMRNYHGNFKRRIPT